MGTPRVINVVGTVCPPADEDRFNAWYADHIGMLLEFKGLKAVTRFRRLGSDDTYPKFLAIYEFDSPEDFDAYNRGPELAAAEADRRTVWGDEGFQVQWRVQYEGLGRWTR